MILKNVIDCDKSNNNILKMYNKYEHHYYGFCYADKQTDTRIFVKVL
jgi:hypothetical protein